MSARYRIILLAGALIVLALFLGHYLSTEKGGFVGDTYIELPSDKYTFLVKAVRENGRNVIKDNLWGFRYPSLDPLRPIDRKEFLTMSPGWVRVSVEPRLSSELCFESVINRYSDPARSPLDVYIYKGRKLDGYNAGDAMSVVPGQAFGLRTMVVPDKKYFKDVRAYNGPQIILWDESIKPQVCTYIECVNVSANSDEQYCTQKHVDKDSRLFYSISYRRENLASWKDIQQQAMNIFKGFESK